MAANNKEIKNHGQRKVKFASHEGHRKAILFQSADVARALISVDKLNEAGSEVILNRKNPRIITAKGEVLRLRRKGGVFILEMWMKVSKDDESGEDSKKRAKDFRRQGS